MFRIVCESLINYNKDFIGDYNNYRYKLMKPFELLLDIEKFNNEKIKLSSEYKKLQDFVYRVKLNQKNYPRLNSLIWALESRGIIGKKFDVLLDEEFNEQLKILGMFLKLSYWN